MTRLDVPSHLDDAPAWVERDLAGLYSGSTTPSAAFVGGQAAADRALAALDISYYARRRSQVWPPSARGASKLSPYIRHGLVSLARVHDHPAVAGANGKDRFRYRSELLWQDYARHWYAVHGAATRQGVARRPVPSEGAEHWSLDPWPSEMRCVAETVDELHRDGWAVNQTRMWLAAQWAKRAGAPWGDGEDAMFRHLVDGSRAANRLGWQWVVGGTRGRSYGFSRRQVTKRAPSFCTRCELADRCPIQSFPPSPAGPPVDGANERPGDPEAWFGPADVRVAPDAAPVAAVWLTAESLGTGDPALAAHPDAEAHFVFDEALLASLRLDGKRLVFLAQCLIDLAHRRRLVVWRGRPSDVVATLGPVAVTFAPVPGFRRIAERLDDVELHPWPWLRPPTAPYLDRLTDRTKSFPIFRDYCRLTKP